MNAPLGECLTGHHGKCPGERPTWNNQVITCTCRCHEDRRTK